MIVNIVRAAKSQALALSVALLAKGYAVAVLNPLRTRRFAEEELQRTKTDAIDALGIARFRAVRWPEAAAGDATA
jgi:transposase